MPPRATCSPLDGRVQRCEPLLLSHMRKYDSYVGNKTPSLSPLKGTTAFTHLS
jgi:hypothetical protein